MGNAQFPKKTFGLTTTDQKPLVDTAIATITAEMTTDKIDLPKGYFLPSPSREIYEVDKTETIYSGAVLLGSEEVGTSGCVSKRDSTSKKLFSKVWKVNMPGFIYRSHESGKWDASYSGISIFVSNNNQFIHKPELDQYVVLLYSQEPSFRGYTIAGTQAGLEDKHYNVMFPITPGSNTYIMVSSCCDKPSDTKNAEKRRVYFIPAYHYGNKKCFSGNNDLPIVQQTFDKNTEGWIESPIPSDVFVNSTSEYFKKCFE